MDNDHKKTSTADEAELNKFINMSDDWWKKDGKFAALHKFNPVRIQYITDVIESEILKKQSNTLNKKDIKILDIGCGGGLVSEPLAEYGFDITGIDALEQNIKKAIQHADKKELNNVKYKQSLPEELDDKKFDAILILELLEHVKNPENIIKIASQKLKQGGLLFISTINKTPQAMLFAKMFAEYILKWVEKGTHDYNKFLKPSEITKDFEALELSICDIKGVKFNILKNDWQLSNDISVNYILYAKKIISKINKRE
jgi:2-polyprenyl-6-hydroxyphenyl methylase/3-demethylubiquinone-9 3-methyltransferase